MPNLPNIDQHLTDLRALHQQGSLESADSNDWPPFVPDDLPDDLMEWLAQLALYYGVPFDNIVADSVQLPSESIRFFFVDENWTNCMLDGALSIGVQNSKDATLQAMATPEIRRKTRANRHLVRPKILKTAAPSEVPIQYPPAGFLLRSAVVSGWPGLEVYAYSDNAGTKPVNIVRMDRLSPNVMIVLFDQIPANVTIAEPKEGLRFGVGPSPDPDTYWIQPRYLGGTDQPTGKPATDSTSQYAVAQFRGNGRNVLDVLHTINHADTGILAKLNDLGVTLPADGFKAAPFAVEMIYTAQQAIFRIDPQTMQAEVVKSK